jgi:hypothetical protein
MNMSDASARATAARTSASPAFAAPLAGGEPAAGRQALDAPLDVVGREPLVDARHSRGGLGEAVLGEQDVRALDADRRQEQAIADLARHARGVVEGVPGGDGVARQEPDLGVEDRHPDRGLAQPELAQPLARAQQLRARSREVAGHRVEHRHEAAHAELGEAAAGDEGQQLEALGPRLRDRDAVDDERPGDDAHGRIEIDGARGIAAGEAQGRPRLRQAPLRRPLHPRELAHQAARPRDADVVAELLERHGGVLGHDEPRAGVHGRARAAACG